ncbi:MAG: hypothetical protein ACR2ON_00830 [Paracoccaceae bacterium]
MDTKNKQTEVDSIIEELRQARQARQDALLSTIQELNPEAMLADGFDDCIMGYDKDGRVIYSVEEIVATLMERDSMTEEEAIEYYDFNIEGSYVGDYTPIYMYQE